MPAKYPYFSGENKNYGRSVVLGDSIPEGVGVTSFVTLLNNYQQSSGGRVVNLAKGGYGIDYVLPSGDNVDSTRNVMAAMKYNFCQRANVQMLVCSAAPSGLNASQKAQAKSIISTLKSTYPDWVDTWTPMADANDNLKEEYWGDGDDTTHPNDAGHVALYNIINEKLNTMWRKVY